MGSIYYENTQGGLRFLDDVRPLAAILDEQKLIMERLRALQMEWERQSHNLWTRYLENKGMITLLDLRQGPTSRPLTDRERVQAIQREQPGRMRLPEGGQ